MAYVSVPKDLTKVKRIKWHLILQRQLICIGIGAAMGIPCYFLFRNALGINNCSPYGIYDAASTFCLPCMRKMECIWKTY